MNALVTRRGLLGATAAVGAVAFPAAASATASTAGGISAEATALLREFHDVAARFNAAGDRIDQTTSATVRVPEPEALFARADDFWVLGCISPERHWAGQRWTYGESGCIAQLRELPTDDGDKKRADRRDEIVGAWDRWHAEKAAARDASGETEASDRYREVGDKHDALLLRLVHMRTADPDIMKLKAGAVLNLWGGEPDRFDRALARVLKHDDIDEIPLSISLMRDMMAQLGAAYRVTS